MYTYVVRNRCTMFTKCLLIQTSSSVILPADLQTFESYACRIRHIHLFSFKEKVSNHVYSSIIRHLSNKKLCLFPALRCFAIRSFDGILEENLVILPLIASSSSLSTIEIRNVTSAIEIHLASFLYEVANSHSSPTVNPLSSLHLVGPITMSTIAQLDNFKRLTNLELSLSGTNFPFCILSSLSKLPSLAWLNLRTAKSLNLTPNSMVYSFAYLRTLSVSGNAGATLEILRSIYGEQLRRVTLGLAFYEQNTTNVIACMERYQEMAPHVLFSTIFVHMHTFFPPNTFAPLSRQLRSLHLVSRTIYIEPFCDLFDPARARLWPALETLTLQVLGYPDRPIIWPGIDQTVPLSSLSMLAASCPKLHTLELYVYYPLRQGGRENEDLENRIHSSQPTDHKLTNLKIIFSDPFVIMAQPGDIIDAVTVSRFIDHVFPNVQSVDISDRFGNVRMDWYSGIKAMMKNYRDVRKRTRAEREPIPH